MAKKSTAPVEQPAPAVEETEESAERDYAAVAAKEPSELSLHILDWMIEKLELEFGTAKEKAAFAKGVDLTIKLRTYHQSSPENQERLEAAKARRAEEKAAKAAAKEAEGDAEDKPAKPAKASGKKATPAPEPEAAPVAAKPKAKAGGKSKAPF